MGSIALVVVHSIVVHPLVCARPRCCHTPFHFPTAVGSCRAAWSELLLHVVYVACIAGRAWRLHSAAAWPLA